MAVRAIPTRPRAENDRVSLGPTEILHLALLGGATRGVAEIDELIATTQALGGSFWQPTTEVITACLELLEARELVTIDSPPGATSLVRVSVTGFDYLAVLMRRDMRNVPEPLFHCLLGIKIALLDLLSPQDRKRQITALINRLESMIAALGKAGSNRPAARQKCLNGVIDFEKNRLKSEIRWLGDLSATNTAVVTLRP
jgi:hypothetical protein